ncbi:hypothetical protein Tco_1555057, partial [Tanacetum coccineum]
MAVLESCPKHNMVAYLEKTEGNAEFHEVIDFLARRKYITAKVAGKHVFISEASIRSDLLFNDANGIDSLPNQAIFDAIQLMGYEGDLTMLTFNKALFSPFNALTSKRMRVNSQKDHLNHNLYPPPHPSEVHVEPQSDSSLRTLPTTHIPDFILEDSGGNQGGHLSSDRSLSGNEGGMTLQSVYDLCISLCTQVTNQAKEIKHLKAQIKKLKKKAKPIITHHRAWLKSVSLKQRLAGKKSLKKNWMQKESVSKQERKSAKAEPSVHKDPLFDKIPKDTLDYMETEDAQDVGRTKDVVNEEKETADDEVSTEDVLSTAQQKVSTDKQNVSTDRPNVSTDRPKVSTDTEKDSTVRTDEGTIDQPKGRRATPTTPTTPTTTPTIFGDDETMEISFSYNESLHLDAKKKFVMYPRFISIFLDKQLMNVPVPLDHFLVNALTSKVFSFMVKKGKHFSGKVTPLFASMLVHPAEDEGATSERPSESQPTPSPPHPSEANSSGGNHGGQSSSDKSLSGNEGDMTLQSVYDLCISLCTQSLDEECILAAKIGRKEILKEKLDAKGVYSKDTLDYMETEDAQDVGRTRDVVNEEKETADDEVSTEDVLSTAQQKVSTDKQNVSTDRPNVSTDRPKVSTDTEKDSTVRTDEVLLNMSQAKAISREKEKGVELKDVENAERPRPTSTRSLLTLKPLPKIDPKDKGKKKIEEEDESDTESEGIPEAKKKFKQLARDEEMARKLQEDWETEEERKRLAEEEATNAALIQDFDDIKARIEADRLLALRLQDEEREQFTVEERAKFLHDTIAAQRRFLAEQRAIAIRNRPPTRTQLRNQMMTYLKHVGNKKHSNLKNKTFEEIQALYEKMKRFDESFTVVGSTEDERKIKEINEGAKDPEQKSLKKKVVEETLKKEDTYKVPTKQDVKEHGTKKRKGGHIKMIARKKPRKQSDVDSDDEHRKCLKIVTFEGTIDSKIMEKKTFISKLDKVSSPEGDYLVIHRANGNFRVFNYLMEVLHIFDRQDLFHLYNLMMEQYSEITLERIELILWGDLKIMMKSSTEENDQSDFWSDQQDWKIVTWRLYEACGVCILELEDGIVIHMLVKRRYPLSKDLLQRMLDLGLEVER